MYVRAVVPLYPPLSFVGAWITTHEFLRHLAERGHEVVVTAYRSRFGRYEVVHEGVRVEGHFRSIGQPDVVIGHAGDDGSSLRIAEKTGAPLVLMVHGGDPRKVRDRLSHAKLAVFNSESLREEVLDRTEWGDYPAVPSVVCPPPVDPRAYRTTPGDRITLVNLSERKGGELFWELAERMPDVKFLGVMGNYGTQIVRNDLPNVAVQEPTGNMRDDVYARTRIVLMPSAVETWGRVGMEAACSGIPAIAHPTFGIIEALGKSAVYLDRSDPDEWELAIRALLEPGAWASRSAKAKRRLHVYRPETSLAQFVTYIEGGVPCLT